MMSIISQSICAVFFLVISSVSFSEDEKQLVINPGVSLAGEATSQAEKITGWHLDDLRSEHDSMNVGYTNLGAGDIYYALYSDMQIRQFNLATKQYLGGWQISPWLHDPQPKEILVLSEKYGVAVDSLVTGAQYPLGCYTDHPLNYGDVDGDGSMELVLFLNNAMVVFSPQYQRVIFSSWLSLNDWLTTKDTQANFIGEDFESLKTPNDPQYESRMVIRRAPPGVHEPGYRGYSKLYIGDFNGNGNTDILVWRKLYVSKLEKDSQRGFTFLRNEWQHFERNPDAQAASESGVAGEFLPVSTPEEVMRGWLDAKQLTWQKGYPSKSECPGQEGQLISEMHDPLLNDPDVLH